MAITRREFVTRLGTLAAAVGLSQTDISKMAEAFAGNSNGAVYQGALGKPRVVWVHGAECTGCSTSLLSFLEDLNGNAVAGTGATLSTGAALGAAGVSVTIAKGGAVSNALYGAGTTDDTMANIADVVIDVVDLQYHETVMGMGGDLAAQWLKDFAANNAKPFVLVVEGACQPNNQGGAWNDASGNGKSWCSIGMGDSTTGGANQFENDMADTVLALATNAGNVATVSIGQCASYGGYPKAKPRITSADAGGFNPTLSQTGAMGTYDFLATRGTAAATAAAGRVINVPGCPTNPWWFCLTVVLTMVSVTAPGTAGINVFAPGALDYGRRVKAVYPVSVHAYCPHINEYYASRFATHPGDSGCLQKIGCKGIATNSLCGVHGWNNQQPQNAKSLSSFNKAFDASGNQTGAQTGGLCTRAGAPCMACTEKGYPDSFVPFVAR